MEKEKNYFKVGFFILIILIILISGFYISKFYISNANTDGIIQGRMEVITLNSQGRFLLWNPDLNQPEEFTIGRLCSIPGIK